MLIDRGGWPFRNPPNVRSRLNKASSLAKGLVGLWPTFVGKGNILRDFSGFDSHGAFLGGAVEPEWIRDGKFGSSLYYDGDDVVDIGKPAKLTNLQLGAFTVGVWFKYAVFDDWTTIIQKGDNAEGWQISFANVNSVRVRINATVLRSQFSTPAVLVADKWQHITLTYDNNGDKRVRAYLDGQYSGIGAVLNGDAPSPTKNLFLGAGSAAGAVGVTAQLAEPRIWNRILSDTEIDKQYRNPWELYVPEIPIFYSVPPPAGDVAVTPDVASTIAATVAPSIHLGSATLTPVIASAIADTTAPTVELGSLVITPTLADAIADVVNPDVIEGGVTVTPVFAGAIAETVTPTVELGSLTVTTVISSAIADVVAPTVEMGSLIITPVISDAIADGIDPAVIEGSLSLTPVISDAIADVVAPSVELASMTITPVFAGSIVDVVDPNVIGGDTSVTPVFAGAIVSTIAPTVLFGSVAITPVFAGAITSTINPVVRISGLGADEALKAVYIGSHPKQYQKRLRIGL